MPNKKAYKMDNRPLILASSALFFICFVVIYQSQISSQPLPQNNKIVATPKPLKTKDYLLKIFSGTVSHSQTIDTVKYSSFSGDNIDILVYKYEVGNAVFANNYEGGEWKVDLSKEVSSFSRLKVGSQKTMTCTGLFGCATTDVIGHKIGTRLWGSADEYFQPGGTWIRTYYTFDKSTNQIVYVRVNFNNVTKSDYLEDVIATDPKAQERIQKIESELLSSTE